MLIMETYEFMVWSFSTTKREKKICLLIARSCPMCRPVCMYFCELLNFTCSNYLCSTLRTRRTRGMTTRTSVSWELHAIRGQRKEIPAWRTSTCCERKLSSQSEKTYLRRGSFELHSNNKHVFPVKCDIWFTLQCLCQMFLRDLHTVATPRLHMPVLITLLRHKSV